MSAGDIVIAGADPELSPAVGLGRVTSAWASPGSLSTIRSAGHWIDGGVTSTVRGKVADCE